jgi:hypothetical protein
MKREVPENIRQAIGGHRSPRLTRKSVSIAFGVGFIAQITPSSLKREKWLAFDIHTAKVAEYAPLNAQKKR